MAILGNVSVQGIAYYAQVQSPDKPGEKGVYKLELVLDEANSAIMESLGMVPARTKATEEKVGGPKSFPDHPGKVFIFKNALFGKGGVPKPKAKPAVYDAKVLPFDGLIGNGSLVNVNGFLYEAPYEGKVFVKAYMKEIQVLDLVPYESKNDGTSFKAEEGFVASTSPGFTAVDDGDLI